MTSDPDEALKWDGDADDLPERKTSSLPDGWNAVGKGSESVAHSNNEASEAVVEIPERDGLSTTMLLTAGVVGGIYLLYSIGWVVGGLRLKPLANFFVADEMYLPWFVLAVAAPALWFLTVWVLTRGKAAWIRIGLLVLGIILLVPWPFAMVGVIGS